MAKDSSKQEKPRDEQSAIEQAEEQGGGSPVPAGTQVSESAGAGRRTQDVMGRMVPEDEQLLEPEPGKGKGK
jgi:hypothetical protein